jgi:DNA replication protein DnaC
VLVCTYTRGWFWLARSAKRSWPARYERGSVLITSNLPFSKWEAIFKDPMTTASAIDRLVHHSVILELNISSYRMEQAKKKKSEEL